MITDEMVEKAEAAASDIWDRAFPETPSGTDAMRAALEAVEPQLIAQGMREAVRLSGEGWTIEYVLARAQELNPK